MQEREIIERFKKKGFNHLSLEDLAVVQQSVVWNEIFKASTGEDWGVYTEKAVERLSHSNFNVKWITRSKSSYSGLFSSVLRGDSSKLIEFLKVSDLASCRKALDNNEKSALHLAAREGHIEILKILLSKGWEVDCKDKHQTTPLHLACNLNHSECVEFLLECNADATIQDSLGRNSIMYAACAPGTESLKILISHSKALVFTKDSTGRSSLHYSIFNPHSRQTEIMKLLLDSGADINTVDNEKKTPLHHACESSKTKAIRFLLKYGADSYAKDLNNSTAFDLAANNNVKKLLGLCMNSEKSLKGAYELSLARNATEVGLKVEADKGVAGFQVKALYKERLLEYLGKVQEAGILNKQYLKKPQLYSGNWMEGVMSAIGLFNELSYCTPSEAVLKVFNVLFPYSKPIPPYKEAEVIMDEFFGNTYTKARNEIPIFVTDDSQVKKVTQELEVYKKNYIQLKDLIDAKEKALIVVETSLKNKENECEKLKVLLNESRRKVEDLIDEYEKKFDNVLIEDKLSQYHFKLDRAEAKAKEYFELSLRLQRELESRPLMSDLESAIERAQFLETDNKNLRLKAGQIFLKSIETTETAELKPGEIYLEDIEVLKRLQKSLEKNHPGLRQRLELADGNQDGSVTKSEAGKVLGNLNLPPQDIIAILRILGFRHEKGSLEIGKALELLEGVDEKEKKLKTRLFLKLADAFNKNSLGIERAFEYLDINHDGNVTFAELSEGAVELKLNINREDRHALFSVLDSDHNGSINLFELKEKLHVYLEAAEHKVKHHETRSIEPEVHTKVNKLEINHRNPEENRPILQPRVIDNTKKSQLQSPQELKRSNPSVKKATDFAPEQPDEKIKPRARKLISRRIMKMNQRYYMVTILDENDKLLISVSLADDKEIPMYKQLSQKTIEKQPVEEVYKKINISSSHEITFDAKESLQKSSHFELISRKVVKKHSRYYIVSVFNLGEDLKVVANVADDPKNAIFEKFSEKSIGKIPLEELFKDLDILPDTCEIVLGTQKKSSLVYRKAAKIHSRYYMISVIDMGDNLKIVANIADDSKKPMYEICSTLIIRPMPIDEIFKNLDISPSTHEITLGNPDTSAKKLLHRKVLKSNGRYYMISILNTDPQLTISLSLADDPKTPMFESLSTIKVDKQPIDHLLSHLKISKTHNLSLN